MYTFATPILYTCFASRFMTAKKALCGEKLKIIHNSREWQRKRGEKGAGTKISSRKKENKRKTHKQQSREGTQLEVCINLHYKWRECCDYDNEWRRGGKLRAHEKKEKHKFRSKKRENSHRRRDWGGAEKTEIRSATKAHTVSGGAKMMIYRGGGGETCIGNSQS
jgi:hypothetical protein